MFMLHYPSFALLFLITRTLAESMSCYSGPRDSLTAFCVNAIPSYFAVSLYIFDRLDKTLICKNCNLANISRNTFDLPGNEIETLNISNCNVQTLEKGAFAGLVYMTKLLLQNNNIQKISSHTFQDVKMLEILDLSHNSIEYLEEDGFRELETLRELDLSYNRVGNTFDLNGPLALDNLNFEHNSINYLSCDQFYMLRKIRSINFKGNNIKVIQVLILSYRTLQLEKLEDLNIPNNNLEDIVWGRFAPNLKRLNLSSNKLKNLVLFDLKYLEELFVDHNYISNISRATFQGLNSLRLLDLSFNNIRYFKMSYFATLTELRLLNISNNKIQQLGNTGTFPLPNLYLVNFDNNELQRVDYKGVYEHIPRIQTIYLRNNPLPCYEVSEMKSYFNSQDVKVFLNDLNKPCNETRPDNEGIIPEDPDEDNNFAMSINDSSSVITLFVFFGIIFTCFSILFFWQYRIYWDIRKIVRREYIDQQPIISSELEANQQQAYD